MKAAILAAGLGTRLRPLTESVPKALLPVLNRPLLGVWLAQVEEAGFHRVAVNTHHLADQVRQFLGRQPWGVNLSVSQEPELLGTGGGLRELGKILGGGPFLAVNGDILTDLDLNRVYRRHDPEALATLVLLDCPPHNTVWLDSQGMVAGIGAPSPTSTGSPLTYSGIQVVGPRMLDYLPGPGPYDLGTAWREALAAGERLAALVVQGHFWQDLGTPAAYLAAHRRLLKGESPHLARFFPPLADPLLGPGAVLEEGVACNGGVCLGEQVRVGAGACLENTVIWDRAEIAPKVSLKDCVVGQGARVTASAQGRVLV
ncbi:MAG: sugar phosphate nucleotidyltransferase [Thermodesulfobacteriota bacterium]